MTSAAFVVIVMGLLAPLGYLVWLAYIATVERERRKAERFYISSDRIVAAMRRRGGC